MAYIEFKNVTKTNGLESNKKRLLNKVNFEIEKGELTVILNSPAEGETVLKTLGGLEKVTSGTILVNDTEITLLNNRKLSKYRKKNIGFVLNGTDLINNLSLSENVMLASEVCKNKTNLSLIIKRMGLTRKKDIFPSLLTRSEKIRTQIAMALAKNPEILLLDNIIDELNEKDCKQVLKAIKTDVKKRNMTVIVVTNNVALKDAVNKIISFKNGKITNLEVNKKQKSMGDISW